MPNPPASALDAVVKGTAKGIPILAGIIAVLLVTIALGLRSILSGTLATCTSGAVAGLLA